MCQTSVREVENGAINSILAKFLWINSNSIYFQLFFNRKAAEIQKCQKAEEIQICGQKCEVNKIYRPGKKDFIWMMLSLRLVSGIEI